METETNVISYGGAYVMRGLNRRVNKCKGA